MQWLAALCLCLLPSIARAGLTDLRITEIMVNPGSLASGGQWIELMNAGAEPVNLNGAWIGADNSSLARQFAGLAPVPPGGFLVVRWNARGSSAGRDFYTGAMASLRADHGSLTLSRDRNLLSAPAMLAYVQWGALDQRGAETAQSRGLWPRDQFLPPVGAGHSQALAPGGSPRSPAGWLEAAAPSPGAMNTAPVSAWRGWQLVGTAALAPAANWDIPTDLLDVISVSSLGDALHYRFQEDAWGAGVSLQMTTSLPAALAGSRSGNLDLALVGPDGTIRTRHFAGGAWGPVLALGQSTMLPPALAYNEAAREMELVAAVPAGQLQLARGIDGQWGAWSPIGVVSGRVAPALAINLLERPFNLLFTTPDGTLSAARFAAGLWSPPLPAGGRTALRPAVAVTGASTVELVITAPDHKVYHNRLTEGVWAGWRWTGLESDTAPALLSNPTDYGLELFVVDRNGRLLHSRFLSDVWGAPWPLGAVTRQPVAITPGRDGGLELLLAGADGSLWHNRFRPSSPHLVSLSASVQPIFDAHCVQCHDGGDLVGGQDLQSEAAFSSLVQVPSVELPGMHRVEPGSPEKSYLFHKVSGTQACVGGSGDLMPQGGRLSAAEIRTIRTWIAQGALDN